MLRISKRHLFHTIIAFSWFFNGGAYADINDSGVKVKWGYIGNIGPERWSQLDPKFALCSEGKSQSPINITRKVKKNPYALTINYQPAPIDIIKDGPTSLMIGNTQTIIDDGHGIQLNFHPETAKESITLNDKIYRLVQFHIHSPSENEWHNRTFPLEIHFVHQSEDGHASAIGVFVSAGRENPSLQKIINNMPKEKGKEFVIQGDKINPMDLIPAKRDYYSFVGSLTTPPCTEGLQWVVMPNFITASPSQILQLRKASGGANARPVQPLNKRAIFYSVEEK